MLTTLKSGYYLGIDGGGTKTHAVISDESGFILGEGVSGGSNAHNVSLELATSNLLAAIAQAKERTYKKRPDIIPEHMQFEGACLGLAGLDTPEDRKIMAAAILNLPQQDRYFHAKRLVMVNDGWIGLQSGTDKAWGVCLVAGTGANCYGLSGSGKEAVAGDWGYVLGDQGSAYAMGRAILQQVIKEYDGRRVRTRLTDLVLEFLHLKSVPQLVSWTYHSEVPVQQISSLAKICNSMALADSLEMQSILTQSALELSEAYQAVIKRLHLDQETEIPVVLIGGLFKMEGRFAEQVIRSILNLTPQATIVFPNRSSAEGAIKGARVIGQKFALFPETAVTFINPES